MHDGFQIQEKSSLLAQPATVSETEGLLSDHVKMASYDPS